MKAVMIAASISLAAAAGFAQVVDDSSYETLKRQILPRASETRFTGLEWRPTFWEGVTEAQKAGKPILIWAMNGHPLGCT